MKKFLRMLGVAAIALMGLMVVALLVLKLINDEQYKEWITSAVKSSTGRELAIGTLELDLNSSLLIKANDVRLANADWGSQPSMLSVDRVEVELKLLPLLNGVADVRAVVTTTDVFVESNTDNTSNWTFGAAPKADEEKRVKDADDGGLPISPLIRELRIQNLSLTLRNQTTGSAKTAAVNNLLIETIQNELILNLSGEYENTGIVLTGNLGQFIAALEGTSTPVVLTGKLGDVTLGLSGQWGPLMPDINAQLKLAMNAPSTSELTGIAGAELADLGKLELNAMLTADDGHYTISNLHTTVESGEAKVSVDGGIKDLVALKGIELKSQLSTSALAALLKKLRVDVPMAVPPELVISAHIFGDMQKLGVREINIKARDEGIDIQVDGNVTHALGPEGVAAKFEVHVASTAALSKYAEYDVPQLGELKISGNVSSSDTTYRLDNLNARLSGGGIDMTVSGSVDDLIARGGIDANIKANIGSLPAPTVTAIAQLFKQQNLDIPLLLPTSVNLNSNIAGDMDQLGLNSIEGKIIDEGIELTLSGRISNVLDMEGVDTKFNFDAEKLTALSKYVQPYTEFELPDQGALSASGRLLSDANTYHLEDFKATLNDEGFNAEVRASISDLLALSGINAELKADVTSLSVLSDLAKTELPATDPVKISGEVSSGEAKKGGGAVVLVNAESNGATVKLDARLADLQSLENIDASIAVNASFLSDFDKFAQTELPEQGPLNLTATVNTAPGEYRLNNFQMDIGEQNLSGSAGIKLAEDDTVKSRIDAQLNILFLDLSPLLQSKTEAQSETDRAEAGTASDAKGSTKDIKEDQEDTKEDQGLPEETALAVSERLFSSEPLPIEALRKYDAEVTLTADRVQLGKTDIKEVNVKLRLADGALSVEPISAIGGNGTIAATFELDASRTPAALAADVTFKDVPIPRFGGGLDFSLDFNSAGDSMAELMGGANGQVLIVMRNARIEKSALTEFGSGLLSRLNPFAKEQTYTNLECGILRMDIKDGKADFYRKLAAQLTEVTWRGGGEINLKNEKLDVGIVPIPKTGFNLSAGSLASLVHVRGTLQKPAIVLDPKDVAVKYGKYMAALSTGGLTLLAEGLLNIQKANEDVCAKILDGTIFDEATPADRKKNKQKSAAETGGKSEAGVDVEQPSEAGEIPRPEPATQVEPTVEAETEIEEGGKKKNATPESKNVQ